MKAKRSVRASSSAVRGSPDPAHSARKETAETPLPSGAVGRPAPNKLNGNAAPKMRKERPPSNELGTRPRVVISKHARTLVVYDGDEEVLRMPVVLGRNPSDKQREGDLATPEGGFYICYKNPDSKYHRFLGLSYPNAEDAERGLRDKLITTAEFDQILGAIARKKAPPWKTALGGEVGLHGPCPNVTWTHGCIAVTREQIERLYDLLEIGDEVVIEP
jgi:murein L,D-transpeptidase YafK